MGLSELKTQPYCVVSETRIVTTESLTTCMEPGREWTNTSGAWNFLKKNKGWNGCEQEPITVIRKETERMEEKEEVWYRSPTWTLLLALRQINEATRIEGETMMSVIETPGGGCLGLSKE